MEELQVARNVGDRKCEEKGSCQVGEKFNFSIFMQTAILYIKPTMNTPSPWLKMVGAESDCRDASIQQEQRTYSR